MYSGRLLKLFRRVSISSNETSTFGKMLDWQINRENDRQLLLVFGTENGYLGQGMHNIMM